MLHSDDSKTFRRSESIKYKTKFFAEYEQLKKNPLFEKALAEVIAFEKKINQVTTIEANFSVQFATIFGEKMAVVGQGAALGDWDPSRALEMFWTEGNIWRCSVQIEGDCSGVAYKYVCIRGALVKWEAGDNRVLDVRKGERLGSKVKVDAEDVWKR